MNRYVDQGIYRWPTPTPTTSDFDIANEIHLTERKLSFSSEELCGSLYLERNKSCWSKVFYEVEARFVSRGSGEEGEMGMGRRVGRRGSGIGDLKYERKEDPGDENQQNDDGDGDIGEQQTQGDDKLNLVGRAFSSSTISARQRAKEKLLKRPVP